MVYKRKTVKPKRPSDNLPPNKLQTKWNEYLDYHVGRTGARPRWEMLITPQELDRMNIPDMDRISTPRSEIYQEACHKALNKLPLMQRVIIKSYYGIDRVQMDTQEEIAAKIGIAQKNVHRWIEKVKKTLRSMIRKEVARLVKKELQGYKISL